MNYEDMTNKELAELADQLDVEVEAKNPSKPNKTELIKALEKYDGITEEPDVVEEEVKTEAAKPAKKDTKTSKRRQQYNDKMKLIRVLITSNSDSQTKTAMRTITWGNRLLGYNTDRVVFEKPWHVRQGALDNMKNATIVKQIQNDETGNIDKVIVPAYNIVEMAPLTKEELAVMADKQKVRNAALDSANS